MNNFSLSLFVSVLAFILESGYTINNLELRIKKDSLLNLCLKIAKPNIHASESTKALWHCICICLYVILVWLDHTFTFRSKFSWVCTAMILFPANSLASVRVCLLWVAFRLRVCGAVCVHVRNCKVACLHTTALGICVLTFVAKIHPCCAQRIVFPSLLKT